MKLTAWMLGASALSLALSGCGSLASRDCGACCKGIGLGGGAAHIWEENK